MGKKGKLLFKGDKPPKKKSKKSKTKTAAIAAAAATEGAGISVSDRSAGSSAAATTTTTTTTSTATTNNNNSSAPVVREGTGKITTSGTVATGHGTKFRSELSVGDALMVRDQLRVVNMLLSDTSLNLSSAFSENLKHPARFRYVGKPRDESERKRAAQRKRQDAEDAVERSVFDIYGGKSDGGGGDGSFVYREKTETGSYRVRQQAVSSSSSSKGTTRGDLLDMRSKKSSDKYC